MGIASMKGPGVVLRNLLRAGLMGAALAGTSPAAWAQSAETAPKHAPPARWVPRREVQVGLPDYIVIGAGLGLTLGATLVDPQPRHARGGILFDESARDALRIDSSSDRQTIRTVSDVTVTTAMALPVVVSALATTWGVRKRPDVAWKLVVVDAEAFAIAGALQGITNVAVSRERPFGRTCAQLDPPPECARQDRYRSFFSGHTTFAFTGAGLVCAQHLGLRLFGPPADAIMCGSAFALATATGVFRMAGDMHYATDVVVGAVVGTTLGLGIPWLHMNVPAFEGSPGKPSVQLAPIGQGLGLVGTF